MIKSDIESILQFNSKTELIESTLFIFDIDSTLYNVSPRTQTIVDHFLQHSKNQDLDPEAAKDLQKIKIQKSDWGFGEALERENFRSSFKFTKTLTEYWRQHFFSNDYLQFDQYYPGAVEYLNIINSHSPLIYLTGRSRQKMEAGTIDKLKHDGFPLNAENTLIMKENTEADNLYKLKVVESYMPSYQRIVIYENEPLIINTIKEKCPNIHFVFINSTHSRKENLKYNHPVIEMDYTPLL